MRTLYADQNFNQHIVLGILEAAPEVHVAPIRQFGLRCADDPDLLEWLAERDGILMSHDFSTVPHFANDRLRRGLPMAGVLMVPQTANSKQMIEEIILAVQCFSDEEWTSQVRYLPL
jgi:hypothetical protein